MQRNLRQPIKLYQIISATISYSVETIWLANASNIYASYAACESNLRVMFHEADLRIANHRIILLDFFLQILQADLRKCD